jgi:hypothetical protein
MLFVYCRHDFQSRRIRWAKLTGCTGHIRNLYIISVEHLKGTDRFGKEDVERRIILKQIKHIHDGHEVWNELNRFRIVQRTNRN